MQIRDGSTRMHLSVAIISNRQQWRWSSNPVTLMPTYSLGLYKRKRRYVARPIEFFAAAAAGLVIEVGHFQNVATRPRHRQNDTALLVGG